MKIYELPDGTWLKVPEDKSGWLYTRQWREINPNPTVAHTIELESCNAVITEDSVYFRDAAAPTLSLEEMQRVTRCMEMLKEAGE